MGGNRSCSGEIVLGMQECMLEEIVTLEHLGRAIVLWRRNVRGRYQASSY